MDSLERLRRYVNDHTNTDWEYATFPLQRQLVNCTDTAVFGLIDAIEAEALSMARAAWREGHDIGFASANKLVVDHEEAMAEHGWVKLPVDADGEVIHVGDAMERGDAHGRVIALMMSNYPKKWGGGLHWSIQLEGEKAPTALDLAFHHHNKPTVEDVLSEFASKVCNSGHQWGLDAADTIAEYAAKLRLAGDE